MKRTELEAMGLTKEQIDSIMKINGDDIENAKTSSASEITTLKTENASLTAQVKERDTQIDGLKQAAGDNEALQKQIEDLQESNKAEAKKHAEELKDLQLTNAIKLAVAGKVHDEDMAAALFDRTKLVLTEDGKVSGLEEQLKAIRESKGFLFKNAGPGQGYDPAGGGGGGKVNPFAKDTFNLTEQGRLLREHPEQARELASAAGVKI